MPRDLKLASARSWLREHGKVLGDHVAKVGTKYADIESAAIAEANYGLWIKLIGKAEARREGLVSVIHTAVRTDTAEAGDPGHALVSKLANPPLPLR